MSTQEVVFFENGQVTIDDNNKIFRDKDETTVTVQFEEGADKGTLQWINYKPKLTTFHKGSPIEIKVVVDNKSIANRYISDILKPLSIDVDIIDQNVKPIFKKVVHMETVEEYIYSGYSFTLFKGHVQSGKTTAIIAQSISVHLQGLLTIILVREYKTDQDQLQTRMKSVIKQINAITTTTDFIGDIVYDVKKGIKILKKAYKPLVIIALANTSQLSKLTALIEEKKWQKRIVTIIDEVDSTDHNGKAKKIPDIKKLKEYSLHVYGVTATTVDTIALEDVQSSNVKILKPLPIYKGLESIKWEMLEEPMKKLPAPKVEYTSYKQVIQSMFKADPNLRPFLKKFSKLKPIYQEQFDDHHPQMYLIKINTNVQHMETLQDFLKYNYTRHPITTLVFNGKGIRLWTYCTDPITIDGKEICHENGYYHLKGISISSAIGYLKNVAGGFKTHPRIIIISGLLASRGISFVSSDYGECIDNNKLGWHIIGEYFNCSDTMPQPELIQSARLFGNSNDTIQLLWYTTPKIKQDFIGSLELEKQILEDTHKASQSTNGVLNQHFKNVCVEKNRMLKRKLAKHSKVEKEITVTMSDTVPAGPVLKNSILRIIPQTLAVKSKKYYDYFIEAIDESWGTGVWISKASVMNYTASMYSIEQHILANTSHPWHDVSKNNGATTHCSSESDETITGLLFQQQGKEWYMRYNI